MYTRVTTGRFDAAQAQDAQDLITSTVAAAARQMPGLKSYQAGLDRQGSRFVAITTWDTEEQARGFRDRLGQDIMQQIQNANVQLDESQIFETVVHA